MSSWQEAGAREEIGAAGVKSSCITAITDQTPVAGTFPGNYNYERLAKNPLEERSARNECLPSVRALPLRLGRLAGPERKQQYYEEIT